MGDHHAYEEELEGQLNSAEKQIDDLERTIADLELELDNERADSQYWRDLYQSLVDDIKGDIGESINLLTTVFERAEKEE